MTNYTLERMLGGARPGDPRGSGAAPRKVHARRAPLQPAPAGRVARPARRRPFGPPGQGPPPCQRSLSHRRAGSRLGWVSLLSTIPFAGATLAWALPSEALAQAPPVAQAPRAAAETPTAATAGFSEEDAAALDRYVRDVLEVFEVPGAAVAVIEDGEVVYRGSFGVRGQEHPEPIDRRTRFMIGSVTKSMTATLVGTLVDDGLLDWDSPVVTWFPSFSLLNAEDPADVTLRMLLSHSTGTALNDITMFFNPPAPLALLDEVATLPTVGVPLGEGFDYHNQLFALAGYAAARAAGAPLTDAGLLRGYAQLLEEGLFEPAGMTRATVDLRAVRRSGNHAYPHSGRVLDLTIAPVPVRQEGFVTQVAPAGGVWASLDDLARYALLLVREGVAESGAQVISAESLATTQTVQAAFSPFVGYGLGWFIRTFGEAPVVEHGGGTAGFGASLWTVPTQGRARVVLTNSKDSAQFRAAVLRHVDELVFDRPHEGHDDLVAEFEESSQWAADLLASVRPVTAREARELAGRYEREVRVFEHDGDLMVRTLYGTHQFRAAVDAEDLYLCLDNAGNGMRLSPERDPDSGRVAALLLRSAEVARSGELQTTLTLQRLPPRRGGRFDDPKDCGAPSARR